MAKPTPKKKEPRPIEPYEPKGYEIKRIVQRIHAENLFESLSQDPMYIPWFYVDNILQRALARVYGQGPYGPVPIKCNEDGSLYVAGLGGGYTRNQVKSGAAPDAYGPAIAFTEPMGRLDVYAYDNKMVFKRTRDGVTWDDEIELFKDSFFSFDCTTLQLNVKNYTPGATARYQIVGWY